ncbi:NAD(P)H-dependent glycerol-3-phosphate dehydrogenase [Holdemania filiformis]|uniref:NAD(P)H-dependent glycerol-3-phosphate dehydrogenase n=1 Tax=Holdemania filiformis TaxID=61171 RepID=UPI0026755D53|nr:NAD(P)H-dependent glycerol-3-phosphate dehydrogenase [Holdemania filiformis]
MSTIGVIGAGTWGMALSRMLANSGHRVEVWSALTSEIDELITTRKQRNLPDMEVPTSIKFTKSIEKICIGKDILLFAVPSVFVRAMAKQACQYIPRGQIIVDVAKGIESDTLLTLTNVIKDELSVDDKHKEVKLVALSGPTHAEEVAKDIPTTIVAACENMEIAEKVQDVFMNANMRVYTNTDVLGVELCGALKNIIALAAGICSGLGYGDNTKAALITRGLAEIKRLGLQMGCLEDTFDGLSGMGDLIVTTTSLLSRNNKAGYLIGQGKSVEEALNEVGMVVEGINAIPAAMQLAKLYKTELPIISAVNDVVCNSANPRDIVQKLMQRDKRTELSNRF